MAKRKRTPYLCLLHRPSISVRREAAKRLRELGLAVVAQYGTVAVETLADTREARAVEETGLFAAVLKGPMGTESMKGLSDEQRPYVRQWNTRFTRGYRKLVKDLEHSGKTWGDKELAEPQPFTRIDVEEFHEAVARYEKETGKKLFDRARQPTRRRKMTPKQFAAYEKKLAEHYKDQEIAYHLTRLAYRLEPKYYEVIAALPDWIIRFFFDEPDCWKMEGENAVGIVFVESSESGGPRFGTNERNEICQEVIDGFNWLAAEQPDGNLSWVYDFQFIEIDVANGSGDPDESYWRDPAMAKVEYDGNTYSASWGAIAEYREDMRVANWSAHAIVVFVTPYANSWHGYASSGRLTLADKDDWGGWGRSKIDRITSHEVCHLYGAADEYTGSGTPCSSCGGTHGCDNIPNGNCGDCARPQQRCVMEGASGVMCAYTRAQIGWADIFVELTTGDVNWAGTDDEVWLDIGDRTFVLDTPSHNDRERDNREGHAIHAPGAARADIKRIMIRKSPDGIAGGWRLRGVRVWHDGDLICQRNSINRWIEDDRLTWTGCVEDPNVVNTLVAKVTTADVMWAGTDDDVTITVGGRSWDLDNAWHNDFERGNTDTFHLDPGTGLYLSDIHSVAVHKSPDGIAGGWKLKGVEVIANGTTIYNKQSINKWMEDNDRDWSDSV